MRAAAEQLLAANVGVTLSLITMPPDALSILREVAWVVHRRRTGRSAVAGRVHREDVEPGAREVGHPAVVLIGDVERHFGRCAGAVHEQHDAIGAGGAA